MGLDRTVGHAGGLGMVEVVLAEGRAKFCCELWQKLRVRLNAYTDGRQSLIDVVSCATDTKQDERRHGDWGKLTVAYRGCVFACQPATILELIHHEGVQGCFLLT